MTTPDSLRGTPKRRSPVRKALYVLWLAALVYNGLVGSVALYSSIFSPLLIEDSGRITVQNAYFVKDRLLGWRMMPNLSVSLQDSESQPSTPYCTTDDQGLRITPARNGRDTVVLLGDSFVQGYYLFDREIIGTRLSQRAEVNVVNAGVGGYSTDQEYVLLTQVLEEERPSWVVLLFSVNDLLYLGESKAWGMTKPYFDEVDGKVDFKAIQYNLTREEMEELTAEKQKMGLEVEGCCIPDFFDRVVGRARKTYGFFPRIGASASELQRQIASTRPATSYHYQIADVDFYYSSPEAYVKKWDLLFQFLTRIRDIGFEKDYRLLVFFVPELAQIARPERDHFRPQDYFNDKCIKNGIDCIDPHLQFVEKQSQTDLYFMDEGHLSPAGADLTAQIISRYLQSVSN